MVVNLKALSEKKDGLECFEGMCHTSEFYVSVAVSANKHVPT